MTRFISQSFALTLVALLTATAQAEDSNWYRIEVMLVAYTNQSSFETEAWSNELANSETAEAGTSEEPSQTIPAPVVADTPLFPAEWQALQTEIDSLDLTGLPVIIPEEWTAPILELEDTSLIPNPTRFDRQHDMKRVWHKAWIEPVQPESGMINHPISIRTEDNPEIDITGELSFHLSRYLHINTDFIVSHWAQRDDTEDAALENGGVQSESGVAGNKSAGASWLSQTGMSSVSGTAESEENTLSTEESTFSLEPMEQLPIRTAHVIQKRRMRSGELHYLDHPMLGVVVKIMPVEVLEEPEEKEATPISSVSKVGS